MKKPLPPYKVILGQFINPESDLKARYIQDGAMVLKRHSTDSYKIVALSSRPLLQKKFHWDRRPDWEILDLRDSLILPSFFDLHFHWVQDEVRTMPKDNLLEWLSRFTWPYEARFKDRSFSRIKAREFFKRLTATGTLGGACYSSIHGHALEDAMKYALGDFVIGNVLMTMNAPKDLQQTKGRALQGVKKFTEKYKKRYALTPRFAPNTHPDVMKAGGKMARKEGSFIQTHLSETKEEILYVLSLYREFQELAPLQSYTEIYEKCGLLSPKTIMGHAIHLSEEEYKILAKTKTAVAHCPSSNAPISEGGLGSGLCQFLALEKHGIPWALGSDIGGGPFLSMLDVMRSFVQQHMRKGIKEATYIKALYRSTVAPAGILQISRTHGNLSPGKWANFVVFPFPPFPPGQKKNGEALLKNLVERAVSRREEYDSLAEFTFYKGNPVYKKEQ